LERRKPWPCKGLKKTVLTSFSATDLRKIQNPKKWGMKSCKERIHIVWIDGTETITEQGPISKNQPREKKKFEEG